MPKQNGPSEKQITDNIRKYLSIKNIWHWKQWQGPMSQPRGVADIIGIYRGRMLAIEVKKPGGILSDFQQRFLENVNKRGGIGFVAFSVDDVIRVIDGIEKLIEEKRQSA